MTDNNRDSIDLTLPSAKRQRVNLEDQNDESSTGSSFGASTQEEGISIPISPPQLRRQRSSQHLLDVNDIKQQKQQATNIVQSPIRLTHISDLPTDCNVDAVRLDDLLGHPLIKECWQFNYLFDVDFLMSKFDEDIRSLVNVKIVHGFWKKEQRLSLDAAASRYSNVELVTAYMPEPFGTHHCKMMILFRHDDTTQVIIHTANMIVQDWRNMCQAVWCSPLLPLNDKLVDSDSGDASARFGSGERFKFDLLNYLSAYGPSRTSSLVSGLQRFNFKEVKAALVASVPRKQRVEEGKMNDEALRKPLWGWQGLQRVLRSVRSFKASVKSKDRPSIVVQVSSIATLGQRDAWLKAFLKVLGELTLENNGNKKDGHLDYHIIFPTPDEIRISLDGYESGASIHTKVQSTAQQKQLEYLHPLLRHWTADSDQSQGQMLDGKAGRARAAPHIKTYIRFTSSGMDQIEWAMVTSANLSTQAWGALPNKDGLVRICSWEIGVVVWPELFSQDSKDERAVMVPTFRTDIPVASTFLEHAAESGDAEISTVVGLRMPYDRPLKPYDATEEPWVATSNYTDKDWKGNRWSSW